MSMKFTIKRGDTLPVLSVTLNSPDTAVDLTTAGSVKFLFRLGTTTLERTGVVVGAPTLGVVAYTFVDADWDVGEFEDGIYRMEVQITFADLTILTIPTLGYAKLVVLPDLGD